MLGIVIYDIEISNRELFWFRIILRLSEIQKWIGLIKFDLLVGWEGGL